MKIRFFYAFIPALLMSSLSGFAQFVEDLGGVPIVPDSYGQKISPDGRFTAGETIDGSYFMRDNSSGELYYYSECHAGMGNCIAADGTMVGHNPTSARVMKEGKSTTVPSLAVFSESYLNAITPDGSRICGVVINPSLTNPDFTDPDFSAQMYVPFYCDREADGQFGEAVILPHPDKDFFGATPQFCSAVWISSDGKTIAGQVIDDSGFFMYPLIYRQDSDGEWSFSLPSEKLFNQDNLPIPHFPVFEMKAPQAEDFIEDPERRAEFLEALEFWIADDYDQDSDPYSVLDLYMTPEEIEAYEQAWASYAEYSAYYDTLLTQYYIDREALLSSSVFFIENCMAMNTDGTVLATSQSKSFHVDGFIYPVQFEIPYIFNLEDDTWRKVGDDFSRILTNQVLRDGTVVGALPNIGPSSPDASPVHSYILLPDAEEFITIAEYLEGSDPSAFSWMDDYLHHEIQIGIDETGAPVYADMFVSGLVSFSDDRSVISAGVDGWSWDTQTGYYFTYVLTNLNEAGIDSRELEFPAEDTGITVYNLQGVQVMKTTRKSDISNLPKGIYLINGKKIAL